MLRKYLPIILAASLISMVASFAMAQSSSQSSGQSPNDNSPSTQQPAQGNAGWHHGPPDPVQRTQELTKKLKLTSDQQTKVQDILQSEHTQMESLRQDNSTSQQDRRSKMMDLHQNSDTQIRALLDSTQQKKWDEMQAKREQWGQGQGHHHGAGDQQTPPPQP
jgi:Spy/CpxP family protein refolding chaperone